MEEGTQLSKKKSKLGGFKFVLRFMRETPRSPVLCIENIMVPIGVESQIGQEPLN